jgi:DNA-binding GntR family transcriptional regulator
MPQPGRTSPLAEAERDTLRNRVYRQLRDAVISGAFVPGRAIGIQALADQFQTSTMPVREALRELVAQHALMALPNRSVTVPVMSPERFRRLALARIALEGLATELSTAFATPVVCKHLNSIDRKMRAAAEGNDTKGYLSENRNFHFTIYGLDKSQVVIPLIESLWLQAGPFIALTVGQAGISSGLKFHSKCIDCLARGDAAGARKAIESDIGEAADSILRQVTVGWTRNAAKPPLAIRSKRAGRPKLTSGFDIPGA